MGEEKLVEDSSFRRDNIFMCPKIKNFTMPLIFLGALVLSICAESNLPYIVKSYLYAISLIIKEILMFCLPFIIFSLVTNSVVKLGNKALKYIVLIVPLICASNFINTMLSYFTTSQFITTAWNFGDVTSGTNQLSPAFSFSLPKLIPNDFALILGVVIGIVFGIERNNISATITKFLEKFSNTFFKFLLPVMPLFIMGTALKLQSDGILTSILTQYFPVLVTFIITAFGVVAFQLAMLSKGSMRQMGSYIKNIIPALVTAFGSMSSAAAMPLTIKGAEQNVGDTKNADIIIPTTVNIHLVGDCFFIPMVALAVIVSFGMDIPNIVSYLVFALHFILAKFAVAAIPGGGVLVMLPIMQQYLGMNADMLALVTAIYILFDPIITTCNVAGNSVLAIIFDRIVGKRA